VQDDSGRKCSFNIQNPAESAGSQVAESAGYELIPIEAGCKAIAETAQHQHGNQHATHEYSRVSLDDRQPLVYAECVELYGSDTDQAANCWDEECGEFIQRPSSKKPRSAEIERIKASIAAMQT
jgi:hypothetical protein